MSNPHASDVSRSVEIWVEDFGLVSGIVAEPRPERIIESLELRLDDMFAGAPFSYNPDRKKRINENNDKPFRQLRSAV